MEDQNPQPPGAPQTDHTGPSGPPAEGHPPEAPRLTSELPLLEALADERGGHFVVRSAAVLVVLFLGGVIVRWAQPVLVPLVLASLLAFLVLPLTNWLRRRKFPQIVAILTAQLTFSLPIAGLVLLFAVTVGPVTEALPKYQQSIKEQTVTLLDDVVQRLGVPEENREEIRKQISNRLVPEVLDRSVGVLQSSVQTITTTLGYLFLTLLLSVFILLEGARIKGSFGLNFGEKHPLLEPIKSIGDDVRAYVIAKSVVSLITSVAVFGFLKIMQVDFAMFWGLLAFPLNFIPTVGAIIASVPPILIAWVDPSLSTLSTLMVTTGLLLINGLIGSFIDPRYVGHAVKLSPLVVFLSMLTWGLLWGPVGMLLAVPIMVSIKLVMNQVPSLAPVAKLMQG